ncbi:MAG: hypothetical protein RMK98_06285, partial [Bacteroidia bacterium]|nr:hypothetical protein [Bacteroidia bacterium]
GKRGWLTTANLEGDKAKDTLDLGWELSVDEAEVMEEYLAWLRGQAGYLLSPPLPVQQLGATTFYQVAKGELRAAKVEERIIQEQSETLQRVQDLIEFYNESNRRYAEKELEDLERRSQKYALAFELRRIGRIPELKNEPYEVAEEEQGFRVIAFSNSEKKQVSSEAVALREKAFDPKRDIARLEKYQELPLYAE